MLGKLKNNPFWKNLWKKGRPFYVQPLEPEVLVTPSFTVEVDESFSTPPPDTPISLFPSVPDGPIPLSPIGESLRAKAKALNLLSPEKEPAEKEDTVAIRVQVSKKWIFEHWDGYPPNGVSSLTTLPGASFTRELNSVGNRTYLTIQLRVLASVSRDVLREELKAHFEREGIPSNPTFTWGD